MRVFYVAMKYDYGDPARGLSFEHCNFYDSLRRMGHDIVYFDFMSLMQERGRGWMNRRLFEAARAAKPDLLFAVLFKEELDRAVIRRLSRSGLFPTVNWFCDDHWRFETFTRHWAPCFNWSVTTALSAMPKYEAIGYDPVIKSQWACNHLLYRKLDEPLSHDVTFVGQPHGDRRETLQAVRDAGIRVETWGQGWENGRLSQEEMIRVFNASRINLNLSNASMPASRPPQKIEASIPPGLAGAFNHIPGGRALKSAIKAGLRRVRETGRDGKPSPAPATTTYHEQIKGRNFEVPGCGGFLLSGQADNLEDYYRIGEEIVCFEDTADLVKKALYYLGHEEERAAIARAGHERTLREHTYAHRFAEIFGRMGLATVPAAEIVAAPPTPGTTEEIH